MVGGAVKSLLQVRGHRVVAPKRDDMDLMDFRETWEGMHVYEPEAVVHCAGLVGGVKANIENPATFAYANSQMGLNVLEACRQNEVKTVINIGSACSYPDSAVGSQGLWEGGLWDGRPNETHEAYGLSKRVVVAWCGAYRKQYGLDARTLILANCYGPGCDFGENSHVIPSMIRKFVEAKDKVVLWGTGRPRRQFLHVEDAAEAVSYFLEKPESNHVLNIGSDEVITIKELACRIQEAVGFKGKVEWDDSKPDGQFMRFLRFKEAQDLGWSPRKSFGAGIRELVSLYKGSLAVAA